MRGAKNIHRSARAQGGQAACEDRAQGGDGVRPRLAFCSERDMRNGQRAILDYRIEHLSKECQDQPIHPR
jgi:hypothetical protein